MKDEKKVELPTLGEVAEVKRLSEEQRDAVSKQTLRIWDVPTELATKFIGISRSSYANKSWLYLQDIMGKADLYDVMVSSGRLDSLEKRIVNLEESSERINKVFTEAQEDEDQKEEANKVPKTFGSD